MRTRSLLSPLVVSLGVVLGMSMTSVTSARAADPTRPATADQVSFFETKVRPVLVEKCQSCHGPKKQMASLRLDSRDALMKGGDGGPVVVPGDAAKSQLLKVIRQDGDVKMPPKGKLSDEVVANLATWVNHGAVWPDAVTPKETNHLDVPAMRAKHWAFKPVQKPAVPAVTNQGWVKTPVDAFVLAGLEQRHITPAPMADRRTLLRRVTFDLTGLPPTVAEITAFEADRSPDAFAAVVERLLASPQYGERWARHWLDVARYADNKGYVFTEERRYPFAFTYRDYVVRAFNEDLPYDRFVREQIAADLLPHGDDTRSLAALGFLTLGRRFLNSQPDIIDDRIDVVCRGLLGLTVACARCHDHKFDPIPSKDYYSLYGVFASSAEPKELPLLTGPDKKPVGTPPLRAQALENAQHPFQPYVFVRGNQHNHGAQVPRQFLEVVAGAARQPFADKSGRLGLAEAVASKENPLFARVMANRVWLHHFGAGLVRTPGDFGLRGEPPTNPALLDFLAATFVDQGWSVKNLHRLILLSNTYQQQSVADPAVVQADPDNRWLARANRRRLDFESLRDGVLAVSGRLDLTVGGPPVDLVKPPYPVRRTLYGFIDRQNLPGLFRTFDFASPDTSTPQRFQTTVPQQSLFLLNSPFLVEQARALATRPELKGRPPAEEVRRLYELVFARAPAAEEVALGTSYLTAAPRDAEPAVSAWSHGYGRFDPATGAVTTFQPLPVLHDGRWAGGSVLPDPQLGWVSLSAHGGHPGKDVNHMAIRRWTAPADGVLTVEGMLTHPEHRGDGVQAWVVASRSGGVASWTLRGMKATTRVEGLEVTRGEHVDFVVGCRADESFDGFGWAPTLTLHESRPHGSPGDDKAAAQNRPPRVLGTWSAAADFDRPVHRSRLELYAQILLLSNEFAFVD